MRTASDVVMVNPSHSDVHRLILPVDLTHEGWRARPLAIALSRRLRVPMDAIFVDASRLGTTPTLEGEVHLRADVDGESVSVEVLSGDDEAEVIDGLIAAQPCARLVIASHGLGRRLAGPWGSVGEALLRRSAHGIVVAGPRFDAGRHADVRRVVAALDAAAPDDEIVTEALSWAGALDVPMVVALARPARRSSAGHDETYEVMASVFDSLPPARVPVTAEILEDDDVATALCRFAERDDGTLLALAPGASDRAVHLLTHPMTSAVVRAAEVPLLLRWHDSGRTIEVPQQLSELPDMYDAECWN